MCTTKLIEKFFGTTQEKNKWVIAVVQKRTKNRARKRKREPRRSKKNLSAP